MTGDWDMQMRQHTAASWVSNNPTPSLGQWCLETDTKLKKVGDGVTAWNSLAYCRGDTAVQPGDIGTAAALDAGTADGNVVVVATGGKLPALDGSDLTNLPGGSGGGFILIQDQKTSGTSGGTFTSGAWRTRTVNTEVVDTGGHASIGSNQITLAAGTYSFSISCPAYAVGRHQAKLYNISDSADVAFGSSEYCPATTSETTTRSYIVGRFTITGTKVFEIQHKGTTTSLTYGFGVEASLGTEIYTIAQFWKENP